MLGDKVGLDDYLLIHTVDDLKALPCDPIEGPPNIRVEEWITDENRSDIKKIIPALAEMSLLKYESLRQKVADTAGIRVSVLDTEVESRRPKKDNPQNEKPPLFNDPKPWPDPVDGASLLDDIVFWILRYVVLPIGAAEAIAAWAIATWLRDELYHAPILAILSAAKRSGKTTLLDLLRWILFRAILTSGTGMTPAVLFRLNAECHPTILIDEAEKLSGDDAAKDLINLLNSGHRKGSSVHRCVGDNFEIQAFDSFGFRVVAAIKTLWDTLMDRSIVVNITRKDPQTRIERFESRMVESEGKDLARKIARWVVDNRTRIIEIAGQVPRPEWLNDRACDNWSPLFAIGIIAGGGWLDKLLDSARRLSADTEESDKGERLLRDIKHIFIEAQNPVSLESSVVVDALNKLESSPWGDLRKGRGITAIKLAAMLRPFKIIPDMYRLTGGPKTRGYKLESFEDVFNRYIPLSSRYVGTNGVNIEVAAISSRYTVPSQKPCKPLSDKGCTDVPSQNGEEGEKEETSFNFGANSDNGGKTLAQMTSEEMMKTMISCFGPGTRLAS